MTCGSLRLFRIFLATLLVVAVSHAVKAAPARDVQALLVSDVHFEPFRDPAKVPQLAAAPASEWKKILDAPASPDQAARFAELQKTCKTRGADTSGTLFQSSLAAMQANAPHARLITISGDLISHDFPCKYKTLFPNATPAQYEAFVVKTLEFVLTSFRAAFPAAPVYAALGNNDSGCDDYRIDSNGSFLAATAPLFTGKLPAKQRQQAAASFAAGGNFSVALPAPFRRTHLLLIDNLFQSRKYKTCAGRTNAVAATAQITWLRTELEKARKNHEQVWVIGHIPPGIDAYATISKLRNVCGGKDPDMFLSSDEMSGTLQEYGDVIRLALFAHTHMDEMRLIEPFPLKGKANMVALKMTPSISPVDGNNPAFTIASIAPGTATLRDYRVIAASNQTGIDTQWKEEYDYAETYHKAAFTATDVMILLDALTGDTAAKLPESRSYLKNYFVGDQSSALSIVWPQYSCSLENLTPESYRTCLCPATK